VTRSVSPVDQRVAVVVMAYGTPRHRDELRAYYTDIRRGRPPTPEALANLAGRYEAIGGLSPLASLTDAQRDALQDSLDLLESGRHEPGRFEVVLGLKHAEPNIEVAVNVLAERGFRFIVGLYSPLIFLRSRWANTSIVCGRPPSRTTSL